MDKDLKTKLENNIWTTRKCRINASERLLGSAKFIEFLNVYYSIFAIIISLLSFVEHNNKLSLASIVLSIVLTISIVYANTTGLRDRSTALKQNYIDMQILLDRLSCIENGDTKSVMEISGKYAELLKASENHTSIDLYRVKNNPANNNKSFVESIKYILYIGWTVLRRGLLLVIPIVGAVYLFIVR